MSSCKDLTGKKFGMLTAIKDVGSKGRNRLWECKCDCGNTTILKTSRIVGGYTQSCGCLHKFPLGEAAFNNLYITYQRNAKIRGCEFNLSKDKFRELTSSECYYCGGLPKREHKTASSNGGYVYNGIDRLDNSQGYILDNCVPCCTKCNDWKKAGTQQEFLDHTIKIYENRLLLEHPC